MVAAGGMVPLGYFKDPEKSARTFRVIDGVRYSFPGDWATVEADGSLTLLGRGSQCINTGGEKVFPEEVEEAVKRHEAVDDCLVVGIPDERFGERIVAVASLAAGSRRRPTTSSPTSSPSWPTTRRPRTSCSSTTCPGPRTARPTTSAAKQVALDAVGATS